MGLHTPVVRAPLLTRVQLSRLFPVVVAAALAVAVVTLAALWDGSSDAAVPASVAQVESAPTALIEAPAPIAATIEPRASAAAVDGAATDSAIVPGPADPTALLLPPAFERYQVQRGETLQSIAGDLGIAVADLLLWNTQLEADTVLIRGEWLWIPDWDAASVAEESGGAPAAGKNGRGGG